MPSTTVRPAAIMFSATPETTWSPRFVTQAKPCSRDATQATPMAASNPRPVECVTDAVAAAAKAANSILPSRPRSTTPARSDSTPAIAHSSSGALTRRVDATTEAIRTSSISGLP